MSLEKLLGEAGLVPPPGLLDTLIEGLSTDSRRITPGDLFCAIPGLHADARVFIPAAVAAGAAAIVTEAGEHLPDTGQIPLVTVPNARVAAACLYDAWYGHPARRLRLVGITGTNGKTSVAAMLRHILTTAGIPCGMIGTVGCFSPDGDAAVCGGTLGGRPIRSPDGMTTPDPEILYPLLDCMAADDEGSPAGKVPVVLMEVTSHALAQGRVAPLLFDVGIFTNLTPEHLDLHGSMEAYFAAKRRLFEVSREAVVNADDRWGRKLLSEPVPVRHWYICHASDRTALPPDRMCPSTEGSCTRVYAEDPRPHDEEGVYFKLTTPHVRVRLSCPVPGDFTVMNATEAAAAALALGVSPATVRDALALFPGVPGRMETVASPARCGRGGFPATVIIDFAHTPDALENLLATVHAVYRPDRTCARTRRIVLLFGCGGDRDRSKRKIMARIASRMADYTIITSDNSRSERPDDIISDILSGMDKESGFSVIPDRRSAIRHAIREARAGDVILLCGKGHENYEITSDGKKPFSEKAILAEAIDEFWKNDKA